MRGGIRAGGCPAAGPHPRAHSGRARSWRAGRVLAAGVLVAGPLLVATAHPATAATSLFDRKVDVEIDLGGPPTFPPLDLDGLGRMFDGMGGALTPPTPAPARPGAVPARTRAPAGPGGSSRSAAPGGSVAHDVPLAAPRPVVTAAPGGVASGAPAGGGLPVEPASESGDADGVAVTTREVPASSEPLVAGAPGPSVAPHQVLPAAPVDLSASDRAAITALDVLAVLLAGTVLVGLPVSRLVRRRVTR